MNSIRAWLRTPVDITIGGLLYVGVLSVLLNVCPIAAYTLIFGPLAICVLLLALGWAWLTVEWLHRHGAITGFVLPLLFLVLVYTGALRALLHMVFR